jgi:hypothetical protein
LHGVPDYGLATGWSGTVHVVEGELDSVPPLVQASAQKARSGQLNTALNERFAVQWQVPCAAAAFAPAVQLQQVPWHYCCSGCEPRSRAHALYQFNQIHLMPEQNLRAVLHAYCCRGLRTLPSRALRCLMTSSSATAAGTCLIHWDQLAKGVSPVMMAHVIQW